MKSKKKKKKSKFFKILKVFIILFLTITILGGVAGAGIALAMIKSAPPLDLKAVLELKVPSILYYPTKNNKYEFMDEAPTDEKREIVSYKDIPQNLINAVVSIEDERFWQHNGIDPRRIVGAALIDIQKIIKKEVGLHGASTITQQLLKNTVVGDAFSLQRKIQEAYLAIELEKSLSKEQILEAYLNTSFFGGSANGVQKAAKQYFNKDVKDLSLIQCAYIAGVTQNPSRFYPYSSGKLKKDPTPYLNRTKTVLYMMHQNNYIDDTTYNNALDELNTKNKIDFTPLKSQKVAYKLNYEWFSRPVMEAVKSDLIEKYNYSSEEVQKLLMYGGLKIYTTMDKDIQKSTLDILNDPKTIGYIDSEKSPNGIIQPQVAAVIMDYHSGEVKAIVGGRGEQPANGYNRAASDKFLRPVGSSVKPLSVYAPAIDSKHASPATVIEDSPLPVEIGKQWPTNGKPYNPSNYDGSGFRGLVTIRESIRRSINLVALKLEYEIGLKTGVSYLEKFGIKLNKTDRASLAAVSLGQFEAANPLKMAAAFGTFGNSGIYTEPILYTKVVDKTGKVLLENKPETRKVLSPQSAYTMYDLLKEPTSSRPGATAGVARFGSMPVAGKTGTTSDKKDFYFAGLTPYYSGAVWIGNDIPKTYNRPLSSSLSAKIWGKIMKEAHKNLKTTDISKPKGIVTASVCSVSGKLTTDLCAKDPRGNKVIKDMFLEGTVPTTLCDAHVEATVNKLNGKLATEFTPPELIETRVFIRKEYAAKADKKYILPTEKDDTQPLPPPVVTDPNTPPTDDTSGGNDNPGDANNNGGNNGNGNGNVETSPNTNDTNLQQ